MILLHFEMPGFVYWKFQHFFHLKHRLRLLFQNFDIVDLKYLKDSLKKEIKAIYVLNARTETANLINWNEGTGGKFC